MSVSINSENCTPYSINISSFQHKDQNWELKVSNDINDKNSALICLGKNEYTIRFGEITDSRSSYNYIDKKLIGIGGWGDDLLEYSGTHILEFYEKENEEFIVKQALPAINGWECNFPGEFKIYYYNPIMIIVAVSGGSVQKKFGFRSKGTANLEFQHFRERLPR